MTSKHHLLKEMKRFERYTATVWPVQRRFIRRHLTPRCIRCFLPETFSPLTQGVCGICRSGDPAPEQISPQRRNQMQQDLDRRMAEATADRQRAYHVLVLFSGGKDSTLMLHRLQTRYPGLKLLAMTLDNTFMSPVALDNIRSVIRATGAAHIMVRPEAALMEKMYRFAFTHARGRGCAPVVDQFDGDFFSDAARNLAARLDIPYIFCGLSPDQVRHILGLDTYITPADFEAGQRRDVAGISLGQIFTPDEMSHWWNGPAWPPEKRPRMVFPFMVWDEAEHRIREEVLKLGLIPRGQDSPLATNSSLIPLMGLVDMATLGYSSFEPEFARMVRQGKADRKTWLYTFETLEYAARTGRLLGRSVHQVMERLSLTPERLGIGGRTND